MYFTVVRSLVGDLMLALFCGSGNKKAADWHLDGVWELGG